MVKKRNNFTGMTLIELLVVIAVISVLIAILIPILGKVRNQSKLMVCRSNLRVIAQAWHMYLDDNNGRFLQRTNANINYGGYKSLNPTHSKSERPLNPYLGLPLIVESESEAEIFRCPCDNGGQRDPYMPSSIPSIPFYTSKGTSYQTNPFVIGYPRACWLPSEQLMDQLNTLIPNATRDLVDTPSLLLLIGDYGWNNCWQPADPNQPAIQRIGSFHSRKCDHNLAFLDGHVDYLWIRKGIYINDEYTVLPFDDLYKLAREVQVEEECKPLN
jgi:prepilin-type N-terminal cleavage/methylation domain-containing protein/prepilin-type processing-associated H-X9-DG protein